MGGQSIRGMVHRPFLGPLQVPKIPSTNHRGDMCLRTIQIHPQHSCVPIETPRDKSTGLSKNLIKAFKGLQDQKTTHPFRHTKSTIKQRHSLRGYRPNPKPSQTQRNRVHSMLHHKTIKVAHDPKPRTHTGLTPKPDNKDFQG